MLALPAQHAAEEDGSGECWVRWWQASKLMGEGQAMAIGGRREETGKALVLHLCSPLGTILGQQCH